jgi:acetyl-CoA synthetase
MMLDRFLPRVDFESYEDFYKNYSVSVPDKFNFGFDVVDELGRTTPDKTALVWCNDAHQERVVTFGEMSAWSNRLASSFASLGVKKGDAVMLILKRRVEYWPVVIALHKIGAVAIPATNQLKKKDLVYRFKAADVKMLVSVNEESIRKELTEAFAECPIALKALCDGPYKPGSSELSAEGWLDLASLGETGSASFPRPTGAGATHNDDIMLLYFTSGTTGMPKMVEHDFAYPLGHILTAKYWQNCVDGGLHFTVAETGWAKASWGKLYGQWLSGSAVMVYDFDKFNARSLLSVIAKYGVTTFCAPPTMYRYIIKEDLSAYDLSKLRYAVVAGEPLNPEIYERFLEGTGLELREGYGQTEMTCAVATYPWMKPKPGSMGRPSPGYHLAIFDEASRPCEANEEGEIVINTDESKPIGLFGGYYRDEERTKSVWKDGVYRTGDTAWMDEDGYIWFVGRSDDIIKSSGYRIGPFEVESALLEHEAVLECAITGVPDDERGEVVKATIVLAKGFEGSPTLVKELQDHVKNITAPYKYPRVVEFVKELPKTISGKIRRVEIRG